MDYRKRENFYTVKEVVEHNTSKDILKEEDRNYQFDFGGIPDTVSYTHLQMLVNLIPLHLLAIW